jgi:hypothetical protein
MSWENLVKPELKENKEIINKIQFQNLSDLKLNRGLKVLSYGNFSTGKTHFALSSPGPVYIIDTENGSSPLADKFPNAKVINICSVDGGDIDEKDEIKNFENFQEAINYLLKLPDSEIGTIVVDSVSDIWEWAQAYAKTKIFKIPVENRFQQQWDWQVPNKLYLKQILKLINKNCNVILCSRAGEEYSGPGSPSGTYKPQCQKKTPYWVDVVLFHELKFINKQITFYAKVEKCRHNNKIIGKIIENPTLDKINQLINEK